MHGTIITTINRPDGRFMRDSKTHIITIASKLFLQKSFKEVTMKEIVEKTGLSKGAFYHYFKSKEHLLEEVLDFFFTEVLVHDYDKYSTESFHKFFHDHSNGAETLVKNYFEKFKGNESESEFSMNYFSLVFDAIKLFPKFREIMLLGLENEVQIWAAVIKAARENGEIKSSMTDEEIAQTFIYLGDGVVMNTIMHGSQIKEWTAPVLVLWDKLYEQIKA